MLFLLTRILVAAGQAMAVALFRAVHGAWHGLGQRGQRWAAHDAVSLRDLVGLAAVAARFLSVETRKMGTVSEMVASQR